MSECLLKFVGYRVNRMNFELVRTKNKKFLLEPGIGCNIKRNENKILIELSCLIENKPDAPSPFNLYVSITGAFEVAESEEEINLVDNAVAILYPYLRSVVSSLTLAGNISSYVLPTMNINAFLKHLEQAKAQAEEQAKE